MPPRGVNVIQADLEDGLVAFGDQSFDVIVLSQTIQAMQNTEKILRCLMRVAFHHIRYEIFNDGRGIRAVPLETQHPIRIDRHDYTLKHIVFRASSG